MIVRAQEAEQLQEKLRVAVELKAQAEKQAQARAAAQKKELEQKQNTASQLASKFDQILQQFNQAQPKGTDQQLTWMQQKHKELSRANQAATKAENAIGNAISNVKTAQRQALLHKAQTEIDALLQLKNQLENVQLFTTSDAMASAQPLIASATGTISVIEGTAISLQSAIRSAIAALTGLVAGTVSGLFVGVSAPVYSPKLANGELPDRFF